MKNIYVIQGIFPYQVDNGYSDDKDWNLTLTGRYFLEAHTKKNIANERVKELRKAIELWDRSMREPELRDGVRGQVFLKELGEKVGDTQLQEESEYSVISVMLKE